jgi:DNA-binding winged helix-turn-helix (wHTH) protein/TolB-like protein/Tfp pilus assembly protein PilF
MSNSISNFYEFGEFRFDAEKRILWHDDELIALPPKAAEVLLLLVESRGNLVERREILEKVWSDTFVEEANINYVISLLRKTLGGDGIIQTIPRRGYRFTTQIKKLDATEPDSLVIERRTISQTLIEEREEFDEQSLPLLPAGRKSKKVYAVAALVLIAVIAVGAYWRFSTQSAASAGSSIRSLAVLPLKGFADTTDDQELGLKITDSVITRLGSTDKIVVRPTSSVLRFSGGDINLAEVGRELQVDAVVDGRVQHESGRLRVNLQLISVSDGQQIWSGQFDGRTNDILGLQDAIAAKFQSDLGISDARPQRPAANSEAYEAYLKGRFLWNQRKRDSYFAALEYFNKAIELDPNFALGYTGIADCYHLLEQRNALPMREALLKAETAANKALELDPYLAEAHTSSGAVMWILHSRWGEAERKFRRAIELNPNISEPYGRLGMLLIAWGRFDEAHVVLTKATELDPTSLNNAVYLGANYYFSKQYERAVQQFNQILAFAPQTERAHWFLQRTFELTGDFDRAVEHAVKERAISDPASADSLKDAYREAGIRGFWYKQIELWKDDSKQMFGLDYRIATRYVLLGETEKALQHIEKNLRENGSMRDLGRVDPTLERIREDRRYIQMLDRYPLSLN